MCVCVCVCVFIVLLVIPTHSLVPAGYFKTSADASLLCSVEEEEAWAFVCGFVCLPPPLFDMIHLDWTILLIEDAEMRLPQVFAHVFPAFKQTPWLPPKG